MGEKTNNIITKTITYDIPDDYLAQTNNDGKTATWTYEGPDKIYLFAYNDSNIVEMSPVYTESEDGDKVPEPNGMYRVCVDTSIASHQPLVSMATQKLDHQNLPRRSETLPDGSEWSVLDPLPPHEVYDNDNITYDRETNTFTYPWKKPHVTWNDIKAARNALLDQSDAILNATVNMTEDERKQWDTYRQILRDTPAIFAGLEPWKVPFPSEPNTASTQKPDEGKDMLVEDPGFEGDGS
jgi:hypothetical protein